MFESVQKSSGGQNMVGALELWSSGGLWCAFPRFPGSIHGAAGVTSHSTAGVPGSKKGKKNYPKGSKRVNNRQEG